MATAVTASRSSPARRGSDRRDGDRRDGVEIEAGASVELAQERHVLVGRAPAAGLQPPVGAEVPGVPFLALKEPQRDVGVPHVDGEQQRRLGWRRRSG